MLVLAMLGVAAPAAQATLSWDVAAFNFGTQEQGNSSTSRTFTLTATCNADDGGAGSGCGTPPGGVHNYGSVDAPGKDFNVDSTSCTGMLTTLTFPGTNSCTAKVTFKPSSSGPKTGTLQTETGQIVALSGSGVGEGGSKGDGGSKSCKKKKKKGKSSATAAKKKKKCKKKRKK